MIRDEFVDVIYSVHPELAASVEAILPDQFFQIMRLLASVPEEAPRELAPAASPYLREAATPISPYLMVEMESERL